MRLARGLSDDDNAVAGVHLATLQRLAEQLAATGLAPRRPATSPIVAAAWRAALDREPGVFDAVKDHPATIRALVRTHRELRDISEPARDAVAECSRLTHDLVRLHRAVTASLEAEFYDQTDILDAAASLLAAEPGATAELGHVILYLPQALTLAEARFARALSSITDTTVLLGLTDVQRADSAVRRSLERMGEPFIGPQDKARVADKVLHASDSDDEVRCVVRDVVRALESTPAHRVAVLYGATHPYARLLHEHLSAAGITVNGAGTRPVIERAIGRGFLDILLLAADDMARADFFRAVSEAPTKAFGGDRVPVSRWERLSRSAAVVCGDDWSDRLQTYAASIQHAVAAEEAREDPYQSRIDAYQRDLQAVGELRAFATTLRERLQLGQTLTTWSELSRWAIDLFHDLYGDPNALSKVPPEEQYAAVTVDSALRALGDLDTFEDTADLQRLIDVLTLELEAALPRVGRFGEGILVAPLSASIGLDVDILYVVGLAEDSFPGRLGEDALLLERVRDASQGELSSYRDRLDAKHRHLLAAFDAAPYVVASFPRGDLRRSTGRLPSRWLLPTLRELCGDKALSATDWESAVSDQITGSPSYALSLTSLTLPVTEQEWRTQRRGGRHLDRRQCGRRGQGTHPGPSQRRVHPLRRQPDGLRRAAQLRRRHPSSFSHRARAVRRLPPRLLCRALARDQPRRAAGGAHQDQPARRREPHPPGDGRVHQGVLGLATELWPTLDRGTANQASRDREHEGCRVRSPWAHGPSRSVGGRTYPHPGRSRCHA